MHLGLIDWLFVPHNLIPAQESPVPLPRFRMAPTLKILMSSRSKKGTRIYYPFLSKSPGKRIPPRFFNGPLWREIPVYREVLHLSWYISLTCLSGPQKRSSPSRSPSWIPLGERCPIPRVLHSSFKVPGTSLPPPSWFQVPLGHKGASMERDAHIRSLS